MTRLDQLLSMTLVEFWTKLWAGSITINDLYLIKMWREGWL